MECSCCGIKVDTVNKLGLGACCEKCPICKKLVEPDGGNGFICAYCQDDDDDAKTICDDGDLVSCRDCDDVFDPECDKGIVVSNVYVCRACMKHIKAD